MQHSAKAIRRRNAGLLVILFLTLAGAWTWRLWPRAPVEVDDSARIEQLKEVAVYLGKAPPEVVQPILASLAMVTDSQLAVLRDWIDGSAAQQLRELTVQDNLQLGKNVREALLLAWLGQAEKAPLIESHLMIAASGDHLGDDVKLYALEQLARRAMSEGQSKLAVTILERAIKLPNAGWESLNQLVEACRGSGEFVAAAAAVAAWIKRLPADVVNPRVEEARDLEVALMLQGNQAEEALSGQLEILQSSPPDLLPERVLDRARVCAVAASQSLRLAPWIEKHVGNFPEHLFDWRGLLGKTNVHPDYRRWLLHLTTIAEGEPAERKAFDLCLRLAACGERGAIPRLCALAEPANRGKECEQFLAEALDRPELFATVLEAAQDPGIATRVVAARLRQKPSDRDFHFAAALAEAASKPTDQSAMVWQSFLRRFPADAPALRRLVQCHLHARQPAMALRVLETMDDDILSEADQRQKRVLKQL